MLNAYNRSGKERSMGSRVETRELGRKHLRFARYCEQLSVWMAAIGGRYLTSWAVIIMYYAALHFIDAYLVGGCGVISHSHGEQDAAIAGNSELATVAGKYSYLRSVSEAARYRMQGFSRAEYDELRRLYFMPVKAVATSLVARSHVATREEIRTVPTLHTPSMSEAISPDTLPGWGRRDERR